MASWMGIAFYPIYTEPMLNLNTNGSVFTEQRDIANIIPTNTTNLAMLTIVLLITG